MLDLPPPVAPVVPPPPSGPVSGMVQTSPAQPAPLDTTLTEDDLKQKIANAASVLGIDLASVKAHMVAQFEAAASAYVSTSVPHDKSAIQAQAVRILAALHALFTASAPAPVVVEKTEE